MLKTSSAALLRSLFSQNLKGLGLYGLWSLLFTLIEAIFLGVFRDAGAILLGKESFLGLSLRVSFGAMLIALLLRSWVGYRLVDSEVSFMREFRRSKVYQLSSVVQWAEKREQQGKLEQGVQGVFKSLRSMVHILVFIPLLVFLDLRLFLTLIAVFLPVVFAGQILKKRLKKGVKALRQSRGWLFGQLGRSYDFANKWKHQRLKLSNRNKIQELMEDWSEQDSQYQRHQKTLELVIDLMNSLGFVLVLGVCFWGLRESWFSSENLILFIAALLLSYKPFQNLQWFGIQQVEVNELIKPDDRRKHEKPPEINEVDFQNQFIEVEGKVLFDSFTWRLERGVHVLQGDNGVGKSTLLKTLTHQFSSDSLVYLDQFPVLPPMSIIMDSLDLMDDYLKEQLAISQIDIKNQNNLSGGEIQKIILALGLSEEANWYFLDEPLSHVSYETRAHLTQVILSWGVSQNKNILMVHHDSPQYIHGVEYHFLNSQGVSPHGV